MKVVSKQDLQANPANYFQAVETTGETLIVTHDERPVFKIVRCQPALTVEEAFAEVRGKLRVHGDLMEPTVGEWENT